ncbi:hypothetical protein L3V43_10895 [Pseudoalteromonas sp. L23]|uniref:hypothetical protein n=1 Tax=unclassified Pseudoalteromonas TaxID=194690 RepID=UPI001EF012F6|nr:MULTISPECIES: hypothetical protein [unclassified Pseudoalteromonas]MCF7514086.1 hypothetical protein [Pseudoalteromonas sp. L7]MCF7526160.1 hypothetical protein [Pseudoalteromonas sp. L23]
MYKADLDFLNEKPPSEEQLPEAYWLNNYYASTWIIKSGNGFVKLNWDFLLPDETSMLAEENEKLLEACRRTLFNLKNPYYFRREISSKRLKIYYHILVCVAEWIILNKDLYNPKKYAFSRLDSDAIKGLIRLFIEHGKDGLQGLTVRLQAKLTSILENKCEMDFVQTNASLIPKNLTRTDWVDSSLITFTAEESEKLRSWLYLKGFYRKAYTKKFSLSDNDDVAYLLNSNIYSKLIGARSNQIGNKAKLFLRQFEMARDFELVELADRYQTTEFLPSDYLSLKEKSLATSTLGSSRHLTDLLDVFEQLSPFISGLPEPVVLASLNFSNLAKSYGAGGDKHHRTTPVQIALQLIDSSVGYIINYGDELVDTFLIWKQQLNELELKNSGLSNWSLEKLKLQAFERLIIPPSLAPLNIVKEHSAWGNSKGFIRNELGGHPGASTCRKEMSLEDAIKFLFASAYCLVASLSARRRMELGELRCGCVKGNKGSYELEFALRKSEFAGKRTILRRPIPNILAKAIFLLEKIHNGLGNIHTKSQQPYLFSAPYSFKDHTRNKPSIKSIDRFVHSFCDFINLEKTSHNRRWYPKSHEFRRFFAIVFFWQFKFANLASISWMLGHVNIEHTYVYIRESIGGKELTKVEAAYSADSILAAKFDDDNECALNRLRNLALKHFGCDDITLVEKEDLELYMGELIEGGIYQIRPVYFTTEQKVKYKMVFEILKESNLNG